MKRVFWRVRGSPVPALPGATLYGLTLKQRDRLPVAMTGGAGRAARG